MEIQQGQEFSCIVERVFPFGAFVSLENGRKGYIRRRELTLSGDRDPREVVSRGDRMLAAVTQLASADKRIELSVRACLKDPWPTFLRSYYGTHDVVQVVVKHLQADGVRVEVSPGIEGFIPLKELNAGTSVRHAEEMLWPDDYSEAVITHIDRAHKRVYLSIRQRQESLITAEMVMTQLQQSAEAASVEVFEYEGETLQSAFEPISLNGTVMVVEDHSELRDPFVSWLALQGCKVVCAASADEALQLVKQHNVVFAIIDLDLPEINGVELARQLRKQGWTAPIAVMSGPDLIAHYLSDLYPLMPVAAFPKPLDSEEIREALYLVADGTPPTLSETHFRSHLPEAVQEFQSLDALMHDGRNISKRLQAGLEQLKRKLRADIAIIFHMDRASQTISLLSQTQSLRLTPEAAYGLMESPVKDVIWETRIVWENHISPNLIARFRKLLDVLAFESCIGIPLEVGGSTEYALFVFDRAPKAFPPFRLREALSFANLFKAALENRLLEERVQAVGGVFLSGQLASAFGHEVYNKVSGLDLQISNVHDMLNQSIEIATKQCSPLELQQVQAALGQAEEIAHQLKRTIQDFQRLMRTDDVQWIDVNEVVEAARLQVKPLALRSGVRIETLLNDTPLLTKGSAIRLQQVVLNLMLNAVQHMAGQPEKRRILRVSTAQIMIEEGCWVQIRFADTGPGIHRQQWEPIFALGFTTRKGGSGLGLYIARSIIESHGGKITVEESLISLGTTFLVQLPCAANDSIHT